MEYSLIDVFAAILLANHNVSMAQLNYSSTILREDLENATLYYLPLLYSSTPPSTDGSRSSERLAAIFEVLNMALVDGDLTTVNHTLVATGQGSFTLMLHFPPFGDSLSYDPTLGLGVLLDMDTSSSGSTHLTLIIGLVVSIPVALAVVILIATVGAVTIHWRQKRAVMRRKALLETMQHP